VVVMIAMLMSSEISDLEIVFFLVTIKGFVTLLLFISYKNSLGSLILRCF
jgi:hypothetical protein